MGQNEASDVVDPCVGDRGLDGRSLCPFDLVLLSGCKMGDQRSLSAHNQNSTFSGWCRVDFIIRCGKAISLCGFLELFPKRVLSDASGVCHSSRYIDLPLGNASGVLSGASGDVLDLEICNKLFKYREMLVFCKNGIVQLYIVLIQEGLIHFGGNIQKRISDAKQLGDSGHFSRLFFFFPPWCL